MFKPKNLLLITVIIILIPSLLYGCLNTTTDVPTNEVPEPATNDVSEPEANPGTVLVEVVYFHRIQRCHSCTYAEEQTIYTLDTYFEDELDSGKLTFQSVNIENGNNAAIVDKYGAYTSQLFINSLHGDTENIKEVQEFWDFIDDDEGFSNLIISKVNEALEGAGL